MKKFTILTTFLTVLMFGLSSIVSAQNLALNPGFESWTVNGAPGPADDWSLTSTDLTGTQEATIVRTGTYSTNLTWTTTSTVYMEQYIPVTAGSNYSFSFWALDNDPGGRVRVAVRWFDSGGSFISGFYGDYTADDPSWQQLSSGSQTAAAGAVSAHIEMRAYDVSGWPGTATIYVDDVEFVAITALQISTAYAISETAMDILYSGAVSTVSASDYSLTGTAAITFSGATIDGTNSNLVHLTGASVNMASDITLDNIADAANSENFDFYAGIMSNAFVNTTNPGGTMANGELATFKGIVSANDAYNNVWFSDAAGAYNGVLIYSSSFDALVAVGDEILFNAKRTVYSDLTELENPELISVISSSNTPYGPDVINGSDIDETIGANTNPAESWEGQFVKIENFTVDSYVDYDYRCSWSDGTTTYYFHIGDNVDYHLSLISLNVGETYSSITGVVDWNYNDSQYRINPREQADVVPSSATARIVGSMNGWNTTDPDYVMNMNANGLYELTKSLDAGDHTYKVLEGDTWGDPNYPGTDQHVILTGTEDVTWKTNIDADLVTHTLPVVAGNFLSQIGGNDWDPTELIGEMTDPDGDDIFTLVLTIPAGNWEGKVTLNNNWDQSTGGNVPFVTDGVNSTTFTYDFPNNTTTISGPPPPTVTITFIVDDNLNMNYDGFFLKGSWDASGQYDPSWGGGMEHSAFYDDGTHGDVTADDHIWTCQQDLVVDGGSNTWEWGVNDSESNWIAGNWQFTVPDQTPQTLTWLIPDVVDLVINEIMYNSPGTDEEWIELYNNTDQTIDLENWNICDSDASHPHIIIPNGYSLAPYSYFTISVATGGAFPFTPDYDGTGMFALNNGGDAVRIWNPNGLLVDIVDYDDGTTWPSEPDGGGPTLSLFQPYLDNALPENWRASNQDIGTPGAVNFPINITTPNGGEVIETNSTFDITWTVEGWDGNIKIELIKDGQDPVLLVSNLPVSNGSFSWFVFDNLEAATDYKILISNMDDTNPYDESDDNFTIVAGYVMPNIVITEIMYNPPESGNDSLEFIELYNNGSDPVNMEGFMFSAGVEFTFPNVELLPDNYLLVSINSAAMLGTFGVDSYQWTGGALSNSGEKIELIDALNNVIDSLTYDDSLPWDTLADGYGPSLTLCNPDANNSVAENWTHSVNFAAVNSVGDSIWATPGFGCQVEFLPGFIADVTYISVGESVVFTDQTLGNPIEWIWTFEGGTPDTYTGQTPPAIVYDEEGTWDVTLYVSD
ncbi:MAG: lamin tail domain-containing protein [Bacteroidetes bacterium]|nr:lamin tail domain-containing protein [Bacteroidota bacterium]